MEELLLGGGAGRWREAGEQRQRLQVAQAEITWSADDGGGEVVRRSVDPIEKGGDTNIDKGYKAFWPEPPFPAFSSGHATQSAAAAKVLMSMFDNATSFVDNTYETRAPQFDNIPFVSRTFNTIWSTAEECAYSRFLGGIHTRQDNEAGTAQGSTIGQNITRLAWKK